MGLKHLIALIFLIALIPACLADPSRFCPPAELTTPCICSTFWSNVCITCEKVTGKDVIIDVLTETRDYGYEYFFVLKSSMQFFPASAFQIKKIAGLIIYSTNMNSLFDEAPKAKDLLEIELRSVKLLRSIQWELFEGIQNLKDLFIFDSPLSRIGKEFVQYAPKSLERITMQSCSIGKLPDKAFQAMTNLSYIFMDDGTIKEVKRTMFPSPAKITEFLFRQHLETDKPALSLADFIDKGKRVVRTGWRNYIVTFLKSLYKALYPIGCLNFETRLQEDPSCLWAWHVGSQRIESLPEDIFSHMPYLTEVRLDGNLISQLPENMFKDISFNFRKTFNLDDNPLKCDCSIRWIVSRNLTAIISGQCEKPKNLHGLKLYDLTPKNFQHCAETERA